MLRRTKGSGSLMRDIFEEIFETVARFVRG